MKKVIFETYGEPEVLQIREVDKPVSGSNEVLVKLYATTVTATECMFRKGEPKITRLFTGIVKPKIKTLGEELAGEIEAVGEKVTLFNKGDKVFGTAGPGFGANTEYICIPEDGVLALKPYSMNYDEAASAVDGFLTALPFLRDKGKIKKGQQVLIYGASGSVGSAAVQIARYYGAEVTGVCSAANFELVKSLGANHVIDYAKEDFVSAGETYDIIFDTVGKISYSHSKRALRKGGVFLEAAFSAGILACAILTSVFGSRKARIAATGLRPPKERIKDLQLLRQLMEEGSFKPVIDKRYSLEQIAEAHRYVEKRHKKGNVVITI